MQDSFSPTFFRQLQQLKIRTRRAFLGSRQGMHRSARKGQGLEFADYRQYTPGDDFRYIDFGVYARTDRLYVREFREEQDLNVMVLLDASTSMGYPEGSNKFELARALALALGYVALTDGDTVTFCLLGQRTTPRYTGPQSLSKAMKELHGARPEGVFALLSEVRAAMASQRIPGKCFFVSDFLYPLPEQFDALDYLRSRNFEICVLRVLAPQELQLDAGLADVVVDAETGQEVELALDRSSREQYALALAEHIEGLEHYCRRAEIEYLLVSSAEALNDIVLRKLPQIGVLR